MTKIKSTPAAGVYYNHKELWGENINNDFRLVVLLELKPHLPRRSEKIFVLSIQDKTRKNTRYGELKVNKNKEIVLLNLNKQGTKDLIAEDLLDSAVSKLKDWVVVNETMNE